MLDFAKLKQEVSIEDAVRKLDLPVKQDGNQLRAACPACKRGGERAIVITPDKGMYYCFASKKGGDLISFVAHVRECGVKEAAAFLVGDDKPAPRQPEKKTGEEPFVLQPLAYLQTDHELLTALGVPEEVCKRVGMGYAPKGVMRGYMAVPIRLPDGTLVGYIGVNEAKMPPQWRLPA